METHLLCLHSPFEFVNIEGMCERGYGRMPRVDGILVSYLSPGTSSSLKDPILPFVSDNIEAGWQITCGVRSGQAGGALYAKAMPGQPT